ncbi:hypothetical protein ScPMuIL_006023 [Solemya velum]
MPRSQIPLSRSLTPTRSRQFPYRLAPRSLPHTGDRAECGERTGVVPRMDCTSTFSRHDDDTKCHVATNTENVCRGYLSRRMDGGVTREYKPEGGVTHENTSLRVEQVDNVQTLYFRLDRNVRNVTCSKLFLGDKQEIKKTMLLARHSRVDLEEYINLLDTRRCAAFIQERGYIMHFLTEEEKNFPLAFSILVHTEVELLERLLRAIYRPQNFYCIHIDAKIERKERAALEGIVGCFPNVFLASRSIRVAWGSFQVLEAEMVCLRDMWRHQAWKYYINLAGQEFPLRTNYELVRILQAMDGANFVHSSFRGAKKAKWEGAPPIPHGLRKVMGAFHIVVNRGFVDYALHNQTAIALYNWCRHTKIPDEIFFNTLNHNPQLSIPGSYTGDPDDDFVKPHISRFKIWSVMHFSCDKFIRRVCILGINQLPVLARRPEFFANKFSLEHDPYAYDCMEELLYNQTRHQYLHDRSVNTCYYSSLWQYKYRVPGH